MRRPKAVSGAEVTSTSAADDILGNRYEDDDAGRLFKQAQEILESFDDDDEAQNRQEIPPL